LKSKINPFRSPRISGAAVTFACFSLLNTGAQAQGTWIGGQGNNNTDNAANWLSGVVFAKDFTNVTFDSNVLNGNVSINEFPFFTGGLILTSSLTQDITITGSTLFTGDADIDMSAAGANLTVNSALAMYGSAHPSVWNVGIGRTLTFNGVVSDSSGAGFTKNGAGTVVLVSANTNTGGTTINGGTLVASNADSLGSGNVVINNSGTLYVNQQWVLHGINPYTNPAGTTPGVANVTVNAGGQLALDPTNGFANGVANLYLNGGSVTGGNTGSSYGGLFLYNGNEQITAGGAATSTISTSIGLTGNNNTITVGAGSALNITNVLQDGQWGAGGFIKGGEGTQTLSAANTYTGTTAISGGTLEIGGAGTLGGGSYAGDISIAGALLYSSSANQTLSGIITGSGSITKNGSGTLTLTQALNAWPTHLFDGAITVNSGTLNAPDQNWQLNTASSITVNGGTLNTGSRSSEVGNLTLNGGTVTSNGLNPGDTPWGNLLLVENSTVHAGGTAASTISVDQVNLHGTNGFAVGAGSTLNVTSKIADYGPAQNLSKSGAGTLTLSGVSTYTGTTAVNEGKLIVNGNISTSVLTTVSSGATLGGSGTVGALTVNSGAFVTPGNSPGLLTVNGNYSQAGQYTAEITGTIAGSQYDQIGVNGSVDVTGGSLVALFSSGSYALGDKLFILLNDGTDAITGTYAGFAQGDVVASYGGFDWQISYVADSTGNTFSGGNDIALMAVPESNVAALLVGFGALALLRRRR